MPRASVLFYFLLTLGVAGDIIYNEKAAKENSMDRSKKIVRTSIIGIAVNIVLVAFKMFVGLIANSIAIILDAVNNLSDALSSVITIIGTKLAGKAPDKKHPYGYGRIEYITSVIIAVIVLAAGVTSGRESITKIINPDETNYSILTLIVVGVAVVVKFLLGTYVKKVGKDVNSDSLVASGSDAFFDAILSLATFVAALISLIWGIGLEGILGVIISVFIIKAGVEMLLDALGSIIGTRADKDVSDKLIERVCSFEEVRGAYDLTLHNYGPNNIIGSVHIEVPAEMTAKEIHSLTRAISVDIYMNLGIVLTVGIYATADSDPETAKLRSKTDEEIKKHPEILQMHGFYVNLEKRTVAFDLVIDFKADAIAIRDAVISDLAAAFPDYTFAVVIDSDYSD